MKLATLADASRDGRLVVVSDDLTRAVSAADIAPTLQNALDRWVQVEPALRLRAAALATGAADGVFDFDAAQALAPLPRSWQWLDGSAFLSHGELMQKVFNLEPTPKGRPLMYQGLSNQFLSPTQDVVLPSEGDGIDFEGEFGVIVDDTPMGITPEAAAQHIRLIVQINDWSLRTIAPIEMKTGFGWVQAKPACSMAPIAATVDQLGDAWRDGRVDLPLMVDLNGHRFGAAQGYFMAFSFPELVAHAARTRALCAGTVIGSGTVSNDDYRQVGSSCIAEKRAIELIDHGAPRTPYMRFGDRVRMEVRDGSGQSVFGVIDQIVARA